MKSLSRYVLRQIAGPATFFVAVMTCVIWLTQSLRLLDIVINRGQSAGIFIYLTALILPSLLMAIVPISFFAGALYTLHKLNDDSELSVMWAAGFSRLQLAIPVLVAASVAAAIVYACGLYLMPLGERTMNDTMFAIRADMGAAILREGTFTTPSDGLTVFIREITPSGVIHGILVHDNKDRKQPITYIAESGTLAQINTGARLIMLNGNIQQSGKDGAQLSTLKFDRYVFDLGQYTSPQRSSSLEMNERYLPELLSPRHDSAYDARMAGTFFAEAHNRLSAPLYCFLFALIALAVTAKGHMVRSSYAMWMVAGVVAAVGLRMLGYAVQSWAAGAPWMVVLLYALPVMGSISAAAIFAGVPLFPARAQQWFNSHMVGSAP
jgi:lipopolysaccharide export system permease protein